MLRNFFLVSLIATGLWADNSSDFLSLYVRNYETKQVQKKPVQTIVAQPKKKSYVPAIVLKVWKYLKKPFDYIPPTIVHEDEKNRIIAHQLHKTLRSQSTKIIAPSLYTDLNMVYDDTQNNCSLLHNLKTTTGCGKFYAAFLLANPIVDIRVLEQRQSIIRFLIDNESIRAQLKQLLTELVVHETVIADFYKTDTGGYDLSSIYWEKEYPFLDFMDMSLKFDHISYIYDYLELPFMSLGISPDQILGTTVMGNISEGNLKVWKGLKSNFSAAHTWDRMSKVGTLFVLSKLCNPSFLWNDMWSRITNEELLSSEKYVYIQWLLFSSWGIWNGAKKFVQKKRCYDLIHTKMNKVAGVVRAIRHFASVLQQYPQLNNAIQSASYVCKYVGDNGCLSSEMQELLQLLETDTFKTESQWSLRGRVKTAYRLFELCKEELTDAFLAIGELDAYITAAELFKTYEHAEHPFSFAVYERNSNQSLLELDHVWNPLIAREIVVANSIQLGVGDIARNVILTGPNAGGKTTFLKSIVIAAIFGQTFGIVPARYMRFTPFSNISMSINIADNIAQGQSLFMAEITRVKELLQVAQEHYMHRTFTLMIIDELFSGTGPEYGQAAGYAVAKGLGKITTNMILVSTHFVDTMKKLEPDTHLFKNYMVTANILSDKTIHYPFVVVPGVSTFNVVDAILYNAGFNDQIMQDFYNQLGQ